MRGPQRTRYDSLAEPVLTPRAGANVAEFSVSELAGAIKRALEGNFSHVRLKGEISGYRGPHASGHAYFALKDDKAKIEAVIWKGTFGRLRFKPEEGVEVIATGRITTYPGSSKYQIVIEQIEPAGVGALMALLEERKRKLGSEGLFAEERKQPIPHLPRVIGIVTSPTGAVIRDMLHGFNERFPAHVLLWPVRVQGETCAAEVARAIRGFNALAAGGAIPRPDVLIVARGGGSLEDLWGFNEEIVVRAAAESQIPLIAAVGHETDWTLIDLAADARAPTPTKAAEWAVPKYSDLMQEKAKLGDRLRIAARRLLEAQRTHLRAARLPRLLDLIALPRQRFDAAGDKLARCFREGLNRCHTSLARIAAGARLERALLANTRAHMMRHARLSGRLVPRLLEARVGRARERLEQLGGRSAQALMRSAGRQRTRFERVAGRLRPLPIRQRIERAQERLLVLAAQAGQAYRNDLRHRRRRLQGHAQLLVSLSYQRVLERGFALVRDAASGAAVRQAATIVPGQTLRIELADGTADAQALSAGQPKRSAPSIRSPADKITPARPAKTTDRGGQGSLF